jgi:hypothetical protein
MMVASHWLVDDKRSVRAAYSSCCQFPFAEFFDISCYENSKYGIFIAAVGHRYDNSARLGATDGRWGNACGGRWWAF